LIYNAWHLISRFSHVALALRYCTLERISDLLLQQSFLFMFVQQVNMSVPVVECLRGDVRVNETLQIACTDYLTHNDTRPTLLFHPGTAHQILSSSRVVYITL
jgi:hypothetical protein